MLIRITVRAFFSLAMVNCWYCSTQATIDILKVGTDNFFKENLPTLANLRKSIPQESTQTKGDVEACTKTKRTREADDMFKCIEFKIYPKLLGLVIPKSKDKESIEQGFQYIRNSKVLLTNIIQNPGNEVVQTLDELIGYSFCILRNDIETVYSNKDWSTKDIQDELMAICTNDELAALKAKLNEAASEELVIENRLLTSKIYFVIESN
jgi:hypothetical protein